jgi:hypothetical protein
MRGLSTCGRNNTDSLRSCLFKIAHFGGATARKTDLPWPHRQQPSHDQAASLWFGSPANLSESFIVGRGAFTVTNELYLRPRKRMRPVKARPLYTL